MARAKAQQQRNEAKGDDDEKEKKEKTVHPPQHQERPGRESEIRPRPRFFGDAYRPAGKLESKVALVTGGDSGIGRAVCVLFAREGADVAFVHLPDEEDDGRETERIIEELGRRAARIPGDVTSPTFCKCAVEEAVRELGKLDILVNNAAFQQHQERLEDVASEQLEHTFRVNVFGYFEMAKAALAHLPRGGVIINTGSITGLEGAKELLDYAATKGAIHAFTKSLAQSLVPRGIRVNCVAPGPVWTPLNVVDRDAKDVAKFGSDTPMGRPAEPEEIAPAYVFFASSGDSPFITGEVLTLLGGDTTAA
jgi:NAD(P)-dependent dehydrogenase (short-subunit alcohol dehydrogenase family)